MLLVFSRFLKVLHRSCLQQIPENRQLSAGFFHFGGGLGSQRLCFGLKGHRLPDRFRGSRGARIDYLEKFEELIESYTQGSRNIDELFRELVALSRNLTDERLRANIVGIAPRISGPIIRVGIRDNQQVKKGDLLFEIDSEDFQAQVDIAAGQVQNSEASFTQQKQNLDRQMDLYRTHVNALQDFQNAQDSFAAAQAQLASAKANLELAKLNLGYTKVFAPVDGYVTNMNTSPGTYVTAGAQLMALVDTSSYWVAGYFKETQLPHIKVGQKAMITMIGYELRRCKKNFPTLGPADSQTPERWRRDKRALVRLL
jgi:biotin carboxyl carrier protein